MTEYFDRVYVLAAPGAFGVIAHDNDRQRGSVKVARSGIDDILSFGTEVDGSPAGADGLPEKLKGHAKRLLGIDSANKAVIAPITTQVAHYSFNPDGINMQQAQDKFKEMGVVLRLTTYGFMLYLQGEDV